MLIPLPTRPLLGAAVALRTWEEDDAEWYVSARDEEIFFWTKEPRDLTTELARTAIRRHLSHPTYAGFAITDLASGGLLGNIALVITEAERPWGEVMYWLAAPARGHGAATEAVRTLARWGFETLPIERIELLTDPDNSASQRVAQRAGFAAQGKRAERLLFTLARKPRSART
ncbi:MAG: GNAT family N-acetyltransferase [Chloroflexi bacterium]|nr:GNAT family N-acetyltransferase [Chloroflexota bacterium]